MLIGELLGRWETELKIQGHSQHTILAYLSDARKFVQYCEDSNLALSDIEASDVRTYLMYLGETKGLAPNSISRHLGSIRLLMSWAVRNGHFAVDNIQDVSIKKHPRRLPNMLDVETLTQILEQPEPEDELQGLLWKRDRAMLELFYSSGLRLSELQGVRFKDLNFSSLVLRVTGKGNKQRDIPFGSKAAKALQDWFEVYKNWVGAPSPDDFVFITQNGNQISIKQIERRVALHAKRAGVAQRVHPHLLRHCFATHMLTRSGDIRSVQEMLGHSSPVTTQIYTHLDFDHLMNIYDRTHPRSLK